jgi:hypothetical protein
LQTQASSCIVQKTRMKKVLIFFLLLINVFFPASGYAQEAKTLMPVENGVGSVSAQQAGEVSADDYQLPYPGLLPSSPFYFLKVFRDNVIGFLITEPLKKAEFNLLQADKRLQSGVLLIEKEKKYELAETTISKGQNYFEEAIVKIDDADRQKKQTAEMKDRIRKAGRKHTATLKELRKNAPKEQQEAYAGLVKRMERLENKLSKFSLPD